jgi:anthranilate synthase/aminodeoxychorismate synthase-like glutamine amidotransferase
MVDDVKVVRNDRVTLPELEKMGMSHLVISPGPGRPEGAGISIDAVRAFTGRIPVLGVCLGHQTVGQVFGGKVIHAKKLMHGKSSMIEHSGRGLFEGLPDPFEAIRYHSLVLEKGSLPADLKVTASSEDGEIMGVSHDRFHIEGVQFHPESFGTVGGEAIFENFLKLEGGMRNAA